jgi:hypothetical protein
MFYMGIGDSQLVAVLLEISQGLVGSPRTASKRRNQDWRRSIPDVHF